MTVQAAIPELGIKTCSGFLLEMTDRSHEDEPADDAAGAEPKLPSGVDATDRALSPLLCFKEPRATADVEYANLIDAVWATDLAALVPQIPHPARGAVRHRVKTAERHAMPSTGAAMNVAGTMAAICWGVGKGDHAGAS